MLRRDNYEPLTLSARIKGVFTEEPLPVYYGWEWGQAMAYMLIKRQLRASVRRTTYGQVEFRHD